MNFWDTKTTEKLSGFRPDEQTVVDFLKRLIQTDSVHERNIEQGLVRRKFTPKVENQRYSSNSQGLKIFLKSQRINIDATGIFTQ